MNLKLIIGALLLVSGASTADAQVMLQKAVIAAGGGASASVTTRSNITIGQAVTGTASNSTTRGQFGFWMGAPLASFVTPETRGFDLQIQAWPNPASSQCQITVTSATSRDLDIRLFDLTGKEMKVVFTGMNNGQPIPLSVSDLPSGSYILAARVPGELIEKQISVVR
ncbi:MAG: T9SS type A sorting domain-containing protein [Bacteroidota bacterium]|nr:T9SS type A sorting domain-containing protein [Bacteroidota bacterium]MDP4232677.1 T9SS type A sorting domain-containing protein [Bacteroidota bacterium]MDP4243190.1 T9SS type A sorting domain-containing protein [Bacteroidota bacterium]